MYDGYDDYELDSREAFYEQDDLETFNQNEADDYRNEGSDDSDLDYDLDADLDFLDELEDFLYHRDEATRLGDDISYQ
jgi:hypothetical protein